MFKINLKLNGITSGHKEPKGGESLVGGLFIDAGPARDDLTGVVPDTAE